LLGKQVIQYNN